METSDDDAEVAVVVMQDEDNKKRRKPNRLIKSQVCNFSNITEKRSRSNTDINKQTTSKSKKTKVSEIVESDDSDMICVDEEVSEHKEHQPPDDGKVKKGRKKRSKQSLVKELRDQDPDLAQDEDLLVETLIGLMKEVTCPDPPEDFGFEDVNNKFICGVCGDKKATKVASARHWQNRHGPRYLLCFACGYKSRDPRYLYKHEAQCTSEDAPLVLKAREKLTKGFSSFHKKYDSIPYADKSKESVVNQLREERPELHDKKLMIKELANIMTMMAPPPPVPEGAFTEDFKCNTCGVTKKNTGAISRHWQALHGPRYLYCLLCGWSVRSLPNLYKHEMRCTQPDSDLILQARALIITSKRRAIEENPPRWPSKKNGKANIPRVKKETVYTCSHCPATYRDLEHFKAHERAHSGARPYRCDKCPAAYTSSQGLYGHKRTHESRYFCDHCGSAASTRSAIIRLLNTHLPERPYPCGECGRRYAHRTGLRIHIDRDHRHLPPPCACQLCPKRYPKMSLLKDHMRKKHGMLLMTRNMFSRQVSTLPENQLAQTIAMVETANKLNSDRSSTHNAVAIAEITETDKETISTQPVKAKRSAASKPDNDKKTKYKNYESENTSDASDGAHTVEYVIEITEEKPVVNKLVKDDDGCNETPNEPFSFVAIKQETSELYDEKESDSEPQKFLIKHAKEENKTKVKVEFEQKIKLESDT